MYKKAMENMNKLSEAIRAGQYQSEAKEKQRGLIDRPSKIDKVVEQEASPNDRILERYLAMRQSNEDLLTVMRGAGKIPPQEEFDMKSGKPYNPKFSSPEAASTVYKGLVERGLPDHVAKAFVLNFQDESGLRSDIVESVPNVHGTRGKGLYQLTGSRRDQFEELYGNDYSVDNQLDFLVWELNNSEKSAGKAILNTDNVGDAAVAIVNKFLRPAAKHAKSRSNKYRNIDEGSLNFDA